MWLTRLEYRPPTRISNTAIIKFHGARHSVIMATELTVQSERAFQKQPHIFVNAKAKRAKSTRAGKGGRRWFKDVGLGFRTPKTAIEGTYIGTHNTDGSSDVDQQADMNCRQKMPVHRRSIHTWAYPHWNRRLNQNAPNPRHTPRVPSLHPQVLQIRKAT